MQPTQIFFRDDDVTELTRPLELVSALLIEEGIPCNYALVPDRLSADAAGYMTELRRRHPSLVRLNQHGHRHERRTPSGDLRADEFGGRRPRAEQLAALRTGRAQLSEMLGASFDAAVFTPPCHKYDEVTLSALDELGFEILSASVHTQWLRRAITQVGHALGRATLFGRRISYHGSLIPGCGLTEVSVAIDVDEEADGRGRKLLKTAEDLRREFERASARQSIVGIMLHHPTYRLEEKIAPLRAFIRWIKEQPDVSLYTIEELGARLRRKPSAAPVLPDARPGITPADC